MIVRQEGDAAEVHRQIRLTHVLAVGADRDGGQGLDADVEIFQDVDLAHAAIADDPFPLVFRRRGSDLAVDQGPAHGAAAVDQQDATGAVLFHEFTDKAVGFEAFDRGDDAAERGAAAEGAEHGLEHIHHVLIDVAQF